MRQLRRPLRQRRCDGRSTNAVLYPQRAQSLPLDPVERLIEASRPQLLDEAQPAPTSARACNGGTQPLLRLWTALHGLHGRANHPILVEVPKPQQAQPFLGEPNDPIHPCVPQRF